MIKIRQLQQILALDHHGTFRAAAKALGPGVDLLNKLGSEGLGYDALLVGGAAAFILGALFLLPVKASLAEMPLPEDPPHQTAS